MSSPRCMCHRV
uniref:Uncharacterized protein n=1 Tax=Anguilla anguilla TaxID=7936 RepID=A0A0E9UN12_ANGAN